MYSRFYILWFCVVGSLVVADLVPERLEAVLVPEQGYHQVGPPELCSDMFVLSVTVAFASKLEQVNKHPQHVDL